MCKYPYCFAPAMRDKMAKILKDQVQKGLIEESLEGAWASPALLVKKSSGRFWLVIDYRGLNAVTIPQNLEIHRWCIWTTFASSQVDLSNIKLICKRFSHA